MLHPVTFDTRVSVGFIGLDSPFLNFAVSLLAIAAVIAGIAALGVLLYYWKSDAEQDGDHDKKRRTVLQYASLAGLSGLLGAVGGGVSILRLQDRTIRDILSDLGIIETGEQDETPQPAGVVGLMLTWQRDPTTTMTIDWHTVRGRPSESLLYVRRADETNWQEVEAKTRPFPASHNVDSVDARMMHRVELTDLEPGTEYQFRCAGYEREYSFRTMPAEISAERPLRFATGGDTSQVWGKQRQVNEAVMEYDLDFIQWGGDLAYADGDADNVGDWFDWFETNKKTLITETGRVIPIIVGIGDHELISEMRTDDFVNYRQTQEFREIMAPFFYELFAFPGDPGYGVLDLGDYLSFFVLDSNCSNPIVGQQTDWLEGELAARTDRPYLFTSYHQAAFPSHRDWNEDKKEDVRNRWSPLFEEHDITVAFENGEHTYKRTKAIEDQTVSEDGIRYAGGGCWGQDPRSGDNRDEWYIDTFEQARHAVVVELDGETADFEVVSEDEEIIDEFSRDTRV